MHDFFFKPLPISEALAFNTILFTKICLVGLLLIPMGFLLERLSPRWRRVGIAITAALVVAVWWLMAPVSAFAADVTPCVVCTLDSIVALVVCWMFWC
jgi:hypothetical protein